MKVFITADIEGVSGVVHGSQTRPEAYGYERARQLMTAEVNAAIEGALEAGATQIVVNDSHGPMTNILIEKLNPAAELITGTPKMLGMMEGIDESFDAALFIGYHARMNGGGVLCHTYNGAVNGNVNINGTDSGEFFLNACVAGYFGVPAVLASGDDIFAAEVAAISPAIETVIVKEARGRYAAKCLVPEKACALIKAGTFKALRSLAVREPVLTAEPVSLTMTFLNSGQAEVASLMPGTVLSAPNVISYQARNILEAYRAEMALVRIAASV